MNADVALFIANVVSGQTPISIKEAEIRSHLMENMEADGGIVKGYTFIGWTLNEILSGSKDNYKELWVGFGMKNLDFYKVRVHGLGRDHLQNSSNEYFFPDEIWDGDGFTD